MNNINKKASNNIIFGGTHVICTPVPTAGPGVGYNMSHVLKSKNQKRKSLTHSMNFPTYFSSKNPDNLCDHVYIDILGK